VTPRRQNLSAQGGIHFVEHFVTDGANQIIDFLREVDAGLPIKELCRKHGFSEPSYYAWNRCSLLATTLIRS
jgi:hypothetical protein